MINVYNIGLRLDKKTNQIFMFLSISGRKTIEIEIEKKQIMMAYHDVSKEIHRIFEDSAKAEGAIISDGWIISYNFEIKPFLEQKRVFQETHSVAMSRN